MREIPLAPLQRFTQVVPEPALQCQLGRHAIADDDQRHGHVVDCEERRILCVCQTCVRLARQPGAGGQRYRAIPARVLAEPALPLSETHWAALGIPVRLAFVFFNSQLRRWVAVCPSAVGATELDIPADAWGEVSLEVPLIAKVQADVEALLMYGGRHPADADSGLETFLLPIDACYRLVARLCRSWKGFSGGDDAWREIDGFMTALRLRTQGRTPRESAA